MLASWVGPPGKAKGGAGEGFLSWAGKGRGVTTRAASLEPRASGGGGTPVGEGHKEALWTCQTYQTRSHTRKAHLCLVGFSVAQMVKHLPIMWEAWVQFLGWEDLLEKEMATHSSILAWKISWMEEPGRLQSIDTTE